MRFAFMVFRVFGRALVIGLAVTTLSPSVKPFVSTVTLLAVAPRDAPLATRGGSDERAKYVNVAINPTSADGIRVRFGSSASSAHDGSKGRPLAPASQTRAFNTRGVPGKRTYQLGGPQDAGRNDYSSDQGQVGYTPSKSSDIGVDTIETLAMDENTFSSAPRLSWTFSGGGHPSPELTRNSVTGRCVSKLHAGSGRFVAQARGYAHGEATANEVAVFSNRVVVAIGTNTAPGLTCRKLPEGLQPMAVCLTNGNEFALIVVWNVHSLRSELAVVALAGFAPRGQFWGFDWAATYPGLQNSGRLTFAKYLGSISLPIAAAVGISAVSDTSLPVGYSGPRGGDAQLGNLTLSNDANRQSFISGTNKGKIATSGYALVFSRLEHKVVFVDLQPLFRVVTGAYFRSKREFVELVKILGMRRSQFPLAFSRVPAERPVVVKTMVTRSAPTAVAALLSGSQTPEATVATADGRLHVIYVGGLSNSRPALSSVVREIGSVRVGRNVTNITYVKDRATGHSVRQSLDSTLILTSRGDREVQWVEIKQHTARVVRTLRDKRIADPIAAEDNNTHGTESYVLSIADYGGSRVLNFRYGPVVFRTNGGASFGMGTGGRANFEFTGSYKPHGRPFSLSVTNVT